jgi:hypothetical protein
VNLTDAVATVVPPSSVTATPCQGDDDERATLERQLSRGRILVSN